MFDNAAELRKTLPVEVSRWGGFIFGNLGNNVMLGVAGANFIDNHTLNAMPNRSLAAATVIFFSTKEMVHALFPRTPKWAKNERPKVFCTHDFDIKEAILVDE